MMMSAAYDGLKTNHQPTLRYLMHQWRREMNVGYSELEKTPIDIILSDLEYINIERAYSRSRVNKNA